MSVLSATKQLRLLRARCEDPAGQDRRGWQGKGQQAAAISDGKEGPIQQREAEDELQGERKAGLGTGEAPGPPRLEAHQQKESMACFQDRSRMSRQR